MSVGASHIEWNGQLDQMSERILNLARNLVRAVRELGEAFAARIQSAAQDGAPWTDRTGNARQGLTAQSFAGDTMLKIVLFHTMSYGIWLEIRFGGRYAIIMRTLQEFFPQLMSALAALVR